MYSLEHFRKQIHDIARPYHWKVEWANGGDGGKGMTPKTKQLSQAAIRTSAIPGLTINEVAVSYFGMTYKLAGTPTYEPLTAQFIIDSDYKVMTEWRNVLIGAIASRVCNKHKKPTFIYHKKYGKSIGAARMPHNYDAVKAMDKCAELLISFGGHAPAAGFSIQNKNLKKFQTCLEKYFKELE